MDDFRLFMWMTFVAFIVGVAIVVLGALVGVTILINTGAWTIGGVFTLAMGAAFFRWIDS